MSISVCLPDARFSLKALCGSDICPVLSCTAVGVSRELGDGWLLLPTAGVVLSGDPSLLF